MTRAATLGPQAPLLRQIGCFGLSGIANTALGLALILAAHQWLGMGLLGANLLGYGAGLALSFALNRNWTFADRGSVTQSAPRFAAVVAVGFGASLFVTSVLTSFGCAFVVAQVLGLASYSVLTFMGFRHVVFADFA